MELITAADGVTTRVPSARYTSAEFARLEADRLWTKVWQVACREEEIPEVGDYYDYTIADQSFLVVRSAPGEIKAFFNACLHRGTQLKVGTGSATELRCSFHSWCWNLDGTNKSVVDAHEFPGLDPSTLCLPEAKVGLWGGFVFVNPDPGCEPLEQFLAPILPATDKYHFDEMRYVSVRSTIVPCNWKIGVEAFIESYHLIWTHPQAVVSSDDTAATYDTFGPHGRFIVPMGKPSGRYPVLETDALDDMIRTMMTVTFLFPHQVKYLKQLASGEEQLPEGKRLRDVLIEMSKERATIQGYDVSGFDDTHFLDQHEFHVFPNMVFGALPGEMFGFRFRPNGLDPESSIFEVLMMRFPRDDHQPVTPVRIAWSDDPDQLRKDWGDVIYQDFANITKQQRGMHSRSVQAIRLSSYQESLITHFHRTLERYLAGPS